MKQNKVTSSLLMLFSFSIMAKNPIAQDIRASNSSVIRDVASSLIKVQNNNLVERPWGGFSLGEYKQLDAQLNTRIGESFEVSAFSGDTEAKQHPSIVQFVDGSSMPLIELLDFAGFSVLGINYVKRYGKQIPVLPKTLNITQLLSLQAHPEGNVETYIIIDADANATLRLGFKNTGNDQLIKRTAQQGKVLQDAVLKYVRPDADQAKMYAIMHDHFSNRKVSIEILLEVIDSYFVSGYDKNAVKRALHNLKNIYWFMLDQLNEIEVFPGQVIHNANPKRVLKGSEVPSAEIHALGNEKHYEILAIEVRRPGATYRLWDNARFPVRALDINAALDALSLQGTKPEEFLVAPRAVKQGVERLVDCHAYSIERLTVNPKNPIAQSSDRNPHILMVIEGTVDFKKGDGQLLGTLKRGESGIMPSRVKDYACTTQDAKAVLIKVWLPL